MYYSKLYCVCVVIWIVTLCGDVTWSGLWHCVVMWQGTNISKSHAASTFMVQMEAAWPSGKVSYITTQCPNPICIVEKTLSLAFCLFTFHIHSSFCIFYCNAYFLLSENNRMQQHNEHFPNVCLNRMECMQYSNEWYCANCCLLCGIIFYNMVFGSPSDTIMMLKQTQTSPCIT